MNRKASGEVYLMRLGDTIKVGTTTDASRRQQDMHPETQLIWSIKTWRRSAERGWYDHDKRRRLDFERRVLWAFGDWRLVHTATSRLSEWFRWNGSDAEIINVVRGRDGIPERQTEIAVKVGRRTVSLVAPSKLGRWCADEAWRMARDVGASHVIDGLPWISSATFCEAYGSRKEMVR